jgi:hypothetical protein
VTVHSHATQHARDRLAERYDLDLDPQDWLRLAREIHRYPYHVTDVVSAAEEIRLAQVPIILPDGTLTVPMVYLWRKTRAGWRSTVVTTNPGGYWTGVRMVAT